MSGSASSVTTTSQSASSAALQSVALLLGGALLIFLVGFAPVSVVHNAAHDTRHASGFPCH